MAKALTAGLTVSPSILAHLGEQLLPAPDLAIAELVKNAYDADATFCNISVTGSQSRTQLIRVSDDGIGMDVEAIRRSFLLIGSSNKSKTKITDGHSRIPLGEKGLGRIAALRIGRKATVVTRPESEPGIQYSIEFNWDAIDRAKSLGKVKLSINRSVTDAEAGTEIEITRLRVGLGIDEVRTLAERLALLQGPFDRARDFKVNVAHPRYIGLISETGKKFLDDADFKVKARLFKNGKTSYKLFDWRGKEIASGAGARPLYAAPAATFEFWLFNMDGASFSARPRQMSVTGRRKWISAFGGIYLFEGPLRVAPYGGPGVDWLSLNLRRASSPEYQPSTNNTVGRVTVAADNGLLEQKTDRLGFVENQAFKELKAFCADVLDWYSSVRIQQRKAAARTKVKAATSRYERAVEAFEALISAQPSDSPYNTVGNELLSVVSEIVRISNDDLQLYRSLSTVGIVAASFAHELDKPLGVMELAIPRISRELNAKSAAHRSIILFEGALKRVQPWVSMPLALTKRSSRRVHNVSVRESIARVFQWFKPLLDAANVLPKFDYPDDKSTLIVGSETLLDSIFVNLIANSLNAFDRPRIRTKGRSIEVSVRETIDEVRVAFADSAGGIVGIEPAQIWLPGRTTTPRGSGFGLTIVKDCVDDVSASVEVIALSPSGGAEFVLKFKRAK